MVDAGHPVVDEAVERRGGRVELEVHLGDLVLDHRVVRRRRPARSRSTLPARAVDRELQRTLGDAQVHGGDERQRPHASPRCTGRCRHPRARHGRCTRGRRRTTESSTVSWLWVGRMPSVSQVSTTVTPGPGASTNAWTICGPPGAGGVHRVDAEPRPCGPVASRTASARSSGSPPSTRSAWHVDSSDRDVVAGLGVPGGEHLAAGRGVEDPPRRAVRRPAPARPPGDPVQVHGHGQGGCRGVAGQPSLARGQLGEVRGPSRRDARARVPPGSPARAARPGLRRSRSCSGRAPRLGTGSPPALRSAARRAAGRWWWLWLWSWRRRWPGPLTPGSHRLTPDAGDGVRAV